MVEGFDTQQQQQHQRYGRADRCHQGTESAATVTAAQRNNASQQGQQ
ncbi:hypothetical protein ZBT109_2086 [Zymobacter palmae]|uniref:Uncharacterized protein n=1 Tax=Zymobacter palmae TaxID=33074 RepID=A0A348HGS8_9GAMM|nr:hypothetical protein ZBT109_2086 [Zymobacter palmae]